jgi:hypothetical protein
MVNNFEEEILKLKANDICKEVINKVIERE